MLDVSALFEAHQRQVIGFMVRRVGDPELAEDLAQQVWINVHRHADQYVDRGTPPLAWIFMIARNVLIDDMRRRKLRHISTVSLELVPERTATADAGSDRQLDRLSVIPLLDRLPRKQRAVMRARFLDGMTHRQAGVAAGVTEDAVKKLQSRALASLRKMLREAA